MRSVRMACGALLLVGVFAAVAAAQGSPPTVAVTAGKGTVTAQPAGPLAAGPTRFEFTRSGNADVSVYLVTLRAGVTVDELQKVIKSDASLGLVFLEGSASLSADAPTRAVTVNLRANVNYVLVSQVGNTYAFTPARDDGDAERRDGAGARRHDPHGRLRVPRVEDAAAQRRHPRRATTARRSTSRSPSRCARARPTSRWAARSAAGARRRSAGSRPGRPSSVQDVLSPTTTNDNEIKFPKAGRYALVCFFGEHNALGMYRVVKVR